MGDSTIKLIVFDLDGTTLDHSGNLLPRTKNALGRAWKSGCILMAATGRPYDVIPEEIKKLPFIQYIASASGAKILDKATGESLNDLYVNKETAVKVCRLTREYKGGMTVFFENRRIMELRSLPFLSGNMPEGLEKKPKRKRSVILIFLRLMTIVLNAEKEILREPSSIIKMESLTSSEEVCDKLLKVLDKVPGIEPAKGSKRSVEVTAEGASKGRAIEVVCARHGISKEQVIAFGDSGNDISMRPYAGTLVAMGNSSVGLKNIADYIAPSIEENGVAYALEHFKIIKSKKQI